MSDYDTPSAFWEARPRARKAHKCCECGNEIAKGEVYWRIAGVWCGEFSHYKMCGGCETLRDLLANEDVECFLGGLFECMEEAGADEFMNPMEVLGAMGHEGLDSHCRRPARPAPPQ